jgi:hypothetical protein
VKGEPDVKRRKLIDIANRNEGEDQHARKDDINEWIYFVTTNVKRFQQFGWIALSDKLDYIIGKRVSVFPRWARHEKEKAR